VEGGREMIKPDETIKEILDRHKKEITDYQEACPHQASTVMPFSWAPGHYAGDVRVCDRCNKILEREDIDHD
jgi:hypothetical protein